MEFVTFEIAKKLKEKGFPQTPDYYNYVNYSSYYEWCGLRKTHSLSNASVWFDTNINRDNLYFAPTISQVLNWLREEKKIAVNVEFIPYVWQYKIIDMSFNDRFTPCGVTIFDSYEQAALAGITYVVDNLI